MSRQRSQFSSLVGLLRERAALLPEQVAYSYLVDDDREVSMTYGELDRQARAIASVLQSEGGAPRRAVLLYPPDLSYVTAFFGCLYAGVIAVPAYPPDPGRLPRTLPRLQAIVADCDADIVLTTSEILGMAQFLFVQAPDLEKKRWVGTDALPSGAEDSWRSRAPAGGDIAFLQYTSGSTGTPKGVVLSHANLLHNLDLIAGAFEIDDESVGVSWLPPYHDMGLIGGILAPMFKARPTVLMSPVAFLQRPLRWLKAISRHRATISGGPNFAYEMCIRKITAEEREALDLSSWSVAFSGAEPVRDSTIRRFAETFASCGFQRNAFLPCYGLAEATLLVTSATKLGAPVVTRLDAHALQHDRAVAAGSRSDDATVRTSCGAVVGDQDLVIVRPESLTEAAPGDVGEIWVSGASVAGGYWRRDEETRNTFGAMLEDPPRGPFLRTGDLGFLRQGQLFVTGRLKDLIILRGRNHYPQDIEQTAEESHPSLRRGCCAAFGIEIGTEERVVLAIEVERRHHDRRAVSSPPQGANRRGADRRADDVDAIQHVAMVPYAAVGADGPAPFDADSLCAAIRAAVQARHDLHVHDILLLRPGTLPKTSSGKVQRRECRESYLDGNLEPVVSSVLRTEPARHSSAIEAMLPGFGALQPEARRVWLEDFIIRQIGRILGAPRESLSSGTVVSSLGLDSFMATELSHRLERTLHVELPSTAFLRDSTIREVAAQLEVLVLESGSATPAIEPSGAEDQGLSLGQQAIWYLHQLAPRSAAYNIQCAFRVVSHVDTDALRRAFEWLVQHHPILRTTYHLQDGQPTQRVSAVNLLGFREVAVDDDTLDAALQAESEAPFDVEAGPLLRVALLTKHAKDHVMMVTVHHIAADLWSLILMLADLHSAYQPGHASVDPVPPLKVAYGDFVRWQRDYLTSDAGERDRGFWKREFQDPPKALELPTDRPRPSLQTFEGGEVRVVIEEETRRHFDELLSSRGCTLYVGLLAAFSVLLSRYSGQEEITIGSPSAGRSRAEFESVVGYFVNPLAIRLDLRGEPSYLALLHRTRERVLAALEHQNYPFLKVVEELKLAPDPSRSPLFQAMFVLESIHGEVVKEVAGVVLGIPGRNATLGALEVESFPVARRSSQFDISLETIELNDEISCVLRYNTSIFDAATAEAMGRHFEWLLEQMVRTPETPIVHLPLMRAAEASALLESSSSWRGRSRVTWEDDGGARGLHGLVEAQVERTPESIAVVFEDAQLTYRELDRRANQLAHHLIRRGAQLDRPVGVALHRSLELPIVLLAILKAGAAYLPLDPDYPAERLSLIVEDGGCSVVVSHSELVGQLPVVDVPRVLVDLDAGEIRREPISPPRAPVSPSQLAYVIFTSGSTGRPKGVGVTHAGICNRVLWMQGEYGGRATDVVLQKTPYSFDVSVWEFFWPLISGARLVMAAPGGHRDPAYLVRTIETFGVTTLHFVPSMARLFVEAAGLERLVSVRHVMFSGEAMTHDLVRAFLLRMRAELHNLYGPTEASVDVTSWPCDREVDARQQVPIGRPIANTTTHVVDRWYAPQPARISGELMLGGVALARGYLGRPALTAERFVPDPVGPEPGGRLYRTGDLARWSPDSVLDYLGRIDHQVKIRGFRIELGEVEANLLRCGGVLEAVVTVHEHGPGDLRLVAHVVTAGVGAAAVRADLRVHLPDYMIPSEILVLERLPRTASGKLDRRALPRVSGERSGRVLPRTALEKVLVELVETIVGKEGVGMDDNFFTIGGHSLLATRLVAAIKDALAVELPLVALFESPVLADLVAVIRARPDGAIAEEAAKMLIEVAEMTDEEAGALLAQTDESPRRAAGGRGEG